MTIAILAMQGAFLEHGQMLDRLGVEHFEIRKKEDLDRSFDGLILPGGESTVMRKLLIELNIYDILKKKIEDGLPVFGTCAGLILLAEQVEDGVNIVHRPPFVRTVIVVGNQGVQHFTDRSAAQTERL